MQNGLKPPTGGGYKLPLNKIGEIQCGHLVKKCGQSALNIRFEKESHLNPIRLQSEHSHKCVDLKMSTNLSVQMMGTRMKCSLLQNGYSPLTKAVSTYYCEVSRCICHARSPTALGLALVCRSLDGAHGQRHGLRQGGPDHLLRGPSAIPPSRSQRG